LFPQRWGLFVAQALLAQRVELHRDRASDPMAPEKNQKRFQTRIRQRQKCQASPFCATTPEFRLLRINRIGGVPRCCGFRVKWSALASTSRLSQSDQMRLKFDMTAGVTAVHRTVHNTIRRPTAFLIGANLFALLARMLSSVILTRLLDAEAFGTAAIISTFSLAIVMLTDFGFYQYTVRSPRLNDDGFLDKVWTVRLSRDILITAAFVLFSGLMAQYVRDSSLQLAFAVASLTLITEGASSMAFATATRDGNVNRLSIFDLIPVLATICISVGLAIWLRNYWALIIAGILGSILKMVLSYTMFPNSKRRLSFDWSIYREVWLFGRYIVPSSIITLLMGQTDRMILVRIFSKEQFGLYSLASTLSGAPSTLMNSYAGRILYPAFSNPKNRDSDLSGLFYEFGAKTRLLFIFLSAFLITFAPVLISMLYDDRYLNSAYYLSILLIAGVINFLIGTENEMIIACGRAKWQLYINLVRILIYAISSFLLFLYLGAIGLVWAVVVTAVLVKIIMTFVMNRIGIARIAGELRFFLTGLSGVGLGLLLTLACKTFWPTIPIPFYLSGSSTPV
jgi:O-antigen/teichoic acid export membrane protein